jgi:hypothetical protein
MTIFIFQVFPPQFRELPPPCLDLFDLDEQFSSEKVRLAQITNKCKYHLAFGLPIFILYSQPKALHPQPSPYP